MNRTINEKADSAVYAIKAKINFTNTKIYNNDFFLSASTESVIGIQNSSIVDLLTNGKMIQTVSSSIELIGVNITNITYNKDVPYFYKMSIVNKSLFRAKRTTLSDIDGLLLYASGS